MFFEPREPGDWPGRSGEDLIPVRSRMQIAVGKTGFQGYVMGLFQQADIMASLRDRTDWRESELIEDSSDFSDPNYTITMTQVSLKELAAEIPPYYSVRISFHYDLLGNHSMEIRGQEVTYQGVLPKSFHDISESVQRVQDGLVQAMLRPEVNASST